MLNLSSGMVGEEEVRTPGALPSKGSVNGRRPDHELRGLACQCGSPTEPSRLIALSLSCLLRECVSPAPPREWDRALHHLGLQTWLCTVVSPREL